MNKYCRLLRFKHWIKNMLIFCPLIFGIELLNTELLVKTIIGFFLFSFIASSIYIINDIYDVNSDRMHPVKCKRPIASGEISIRKAWIIVCCLIIIVICFEILLNDKILGVLYLIVYLILNIAYSCGLKNYPIIDLIILVSGFLIRVLYGSEITDIKISGWLYLTVISFAFYLSLGKRRNELEKHGIKPETRRVLRYYSKDFLDKNMYMYLALTNSFYALWAMEDKKMIWTVPIMMIICLKYSLNIEGDSEGDPVEVLIKDKILIVLCIIYILSVLAILYGGI